MSSWRGPTSSMRWTRRCSPRSATPSARSGRDPRGAGDPALRPGQAFHRRARPRICRRSSSPRTPDPGAGGRGAAPAYRMAAGRVQRARGGAGAGDRRDPRRLHRRRGRPRLGLRPPRRQRRRLLPGRRGRRRDHRRSRHAAAARLSDPAGRAARARLYRPADGRRGGGALRPRQPRSRRTARRRSRPGMDAGADDRRQVAAGGGRRQEEPQPQPRPDRSRRGCATSPCGTRRLWSAPTSTEAIKARLGKTEPSFGPLDD